MRKPKGGKKKNPNLVDRSLKNRPTKTSNPGGGGSQKKKPQKRSFGRSQRRSKSRGHVTRDAKVKRIGKLGGNGAEGRNGSEMESPRGAVEP